MNPSVFDKLLSSILIMHFHTNPQTAIIWWQYSLYDHLRSVSLFRPLVNLSQMIHKSAYPAFHSWIYKKVLVLNIGKRFDNF